MNNYIYAEPKKGKQIILQELSVALHEEWSRGTPYHLKYTREVSCMGFCTWRSLPILTLTPYPLGVLCKIKK